MIFEETRTVIRKADHELNRFQRAIDVVFSGLDKLYRVLALLEPGLAAVERALRVAAIVLGRFAKLLRQFPLRNTYGTIIRGSASLVTPLVTTMRSIVRAIRRQRPRIRRKVETMKRAIFKAQSALARVGSALSFLERVLRILDRLCELLKEQQANIEGQNKDFYRDMHAQLVVAEQGLDKLKDFLDPIEDRFREIETRYQEIVSVRKALRVHTATARSILRRALATTRRFTPWVKQLQKKMGWLAGVATAMLSWIPGLTTFFAWFNGKLSTLLAGIATQLNGPIQLALLPLETLILDLLTEVNQLVTQLEALAAQLEGDAHTFVHEIEKELGSFKPIIDEFMRVKPKKVTLERWMGPAIRRAKAELEGLLERLERLAENARKLRQAARATEQHLEGVGQLRMEDTAPFFGRDVFRQVDAFSEVLKKNWLVVNEHTTGGEPRTPEQVHQIREAFGRTLFELGELEIVHQRFMLQQPRLPDTYFDDLERIRFPELEPLFSDADATGTPSGPNG